jgi:hypothetical protein
MRERAIRLLQSGVLDLQSVAGETGLSFNAVRLLSEELESQSDEDSSPTLRSPSKALAELKPPGCDSFVDVNGLLKKSITKLTEVYEHCSAEDRRNKIKLAIICAIEAIQ